MRPGERRYLAAPDILRIVSIGLVGWYHIWQQSWLDPGFFLGKRYIDLQAVVRHGYMMVDVILVISGFLLVLPHARARLGLGERPSVREFYLKRFWRIIPSYVLAIVLCLVLWVLPRGEYADGGFLARDLLAHFTFTHNLFYDTYFFTPLPVVLWTMGVEVQFYLLFPLVGRLFEEKPGLTCLGLALAAFLFRAAVYPMEDTTILVNQLPGMLDLYACGMAAGYLYVRLERKELRPALRWALAGLALVALLAILQLLYHGIVGDYPGIRRQQMVFRLPLGLAAGVFLLCGGLGPAVLARALGNPVTRFFSAISYNFYIWHTVAALRLKDARIPAYEAVENPNMAGEQPWQTRYTLLCFLAAILVSAAVTYLWERPLNRYGLRRMTDHKRSGSV